MSPEPLVSFRHVDKRFGASTALDDVSVDIEPGHIIGLLGANGCGKSTLLRHVIGLYLPDSGTVTTLGCKAAKLGPEQLSRIGYVHQEGDLIDWMTVDQLIRYVAAYYSNWDTELEKQFVADFKLNRKDKVGALSPGNRQMLAILLAIAFDADLLLLDEPAAGLDPIARSRFLDLLLTMIQRDNRTIVISSHILADVEKVVDQVIIMTDHSIATHTELDELRETYTRVMVTATSGTLPTEWPLDTIIDTEINGSQALLTLKNASFTDTQASLATVNCNAELQPLSLDEIYAIVVEGKDDAQ